MRKISAIEPQQKNPQRVNVYLDGEFAFGLAHITAGWLKVGQELSEEKIASLQADDASEMTYQKALHFLSYRPRSSAEVRQNLVKRGTPEALVQETLVRLERAGLVNDRNFAQAWVDNRNTFQPRSKSALRFELKRKGLSDEVVQTVLDEKVDDEFLAFEAARKYASRLAGREWLDFRQKLSGFLARRGFSFTTITPIVSKVWNDIQTADEGKTLDDKD
jgi:regulatory protein